MQPNGHLAIIGATASGKSSLALEVARRRPGTELVSMDSMALYRGMDIGTAAPTAAERAANESAKRHQSTMPYLAMKSCFMSTPHTRGSHGFPRLAASRVPTRCPHRRACRVPSVRGRFGGRSEAGAARPWGPWRVLASRVYSSGWEEVR